MLMDFNNLSTPAKVGVIIGVCCIGIIILGIIGGMVSPDKNTNSTVKNNNTNNDTTDDGSVTLTLEGKSFKIYNLTDDEIKKIEGNNTGSITIYTKEGTMCYMIHKESSKTTILNELLPEDNITKITTDGITYQNIIFSDGTPSTTVFKTKDGSIYEINYYNGNDFLFDYQDFGKQMNT